MEKRDRALQIKINKAVLKLQKLDDEAILLVKQMSNGTPFVFNGVPNFHDLMKKFTSIKHRMIKLRSKIKDMEAIHV